MVPSDNGALGAGEWRHSLQTSASLGPSLLEGRLRFLLALKYYMTIRLRSKELVSEQKLMQSSTVEARCAGTHPIIPEFGRLRQEDCQFEASLGCMVRQLPSNPQFDLQIATLFGCSLSCSESWPNLAET